MYLDLEEHEKFTHSKFNIFFLHKPFSGFYKENHMQKEEIYTDLKTFAQTWFACLLVFQVWLSEMRSVPGAANHYPQVRNLSKCWYNGHPSPKDPTQIGLICIHCI